MKRYQVMLVVDRLVEAENEGMAGLAAQLDLKAALDAIGWQYGDIVVDVIFPFGSEWEQK